MGFFSDLIDLIFDRPQKKEPVVYEFIICEVCAAPIEKGETECKYCGNTEHFYHGTTDRRTEYEDYYKPWEHTFRHSEIWKSPYYDRDKEHETKYKLLNDNMERDYTLRFCAVCGQKIHETAPDYCEYCGNAKHIFRHNVYGIKYDEDEYIDELYNNPHYDNVIAQKSIEIKRHKYDSMSFPSSPSSSYNTPKCPTCGSTNIKRISTSAKVADTAMYGILGTKRNQQFECQNPNCKYKW